MKNILCSLWQRSPFDKRLHPGRPLQPSCEGRFQSHSSACLPFHGFVSQRCYYRARLFTLIELLVVISIIVMLLSMLLPAIHKAKRMAKKVVCTSNLKQISLACTSYASDWYGYCPLWMVSNYATSGWCQTAGPLAAYFSGNNAFASILRCPEKRFQYAYNLYVGGNMTQSQYPPHRMINFKYPSKCMTFGDSTGAGGPTLMWWFLSGDTRGQITSCDRWDFPHPGKSHALGAGYEAAFLDGHVGYFLDHNALIDAHIMIYSNTLNGFRNWGGLYP